MKIHNVKPGMILSKDILDEHGNLLLEKGITLTEAYINRLKQLNIKNVQVIDPLVLELRQTQVLSTELREEITSCYRASYEAFTSKMLSVKEQTIYIRRLTQTVGNTIDEIEHNFPRILNIRVRMPAQDEANHAVNVCLLSVITGMYIKLPKQDLFHLAMGALLHDIGKTVIPSVDGKSLNSPTLHTLYGQSLLRKHRLPLSVARVAAEHHEHCDGSGYPLGLMGKAIHPLSKIAAIADYYDNAVNKSGATGTKRPEIVEKMMAQGNTKFDLNFLRAFFLTTAVYPVGSLVELNTGAQGYVITNHTRFPLRPVVRVMTASGHVDIDLVYKPNITITNLIEE